MMIAVTSVPNTFQPLPRTSWRLRPKADSSGGCSMTTTGMMTAQMVIRNRPGTMSRSSPMEMAKPASRPTTVTGRSTGTAAPTVSRSTGRPGRRARSWADLVRAAWTRNWPAGGSGCPGTGSRPSSAWRSVQDGRGQEYDEGDPDQMPGVRPVRPPGLAQDARKWIHGGDRTGRGRRPVYAPMLLITCLTRV